MFKTIMERQCGIMMKVLSHVACLGLYPALPFTSSVAWRPDLNLLHQLFICEVEDIAPTAWEDSQN
jgi:hypothetical protein